MDHFRHPVALGGISSRARPPDDDGFHRARFELRYPVLVEWTEDDLHVCQFADFERMRLVSWQSNEQGTRVTILRLRRVCDTTWVTQMDRSVCRSVNGATVRLPPLSDYLLPSLTWTRVTDPEVLAKLETAYAAFQAEHGPRVAVDVIHGWWES